MPGEIELLTAEQRLAHVEKQITEYEQRKGVLAIQPRNDVEEYLNMSRDQMRKLSADECGEAGAILGLYALHLQTVYNKELAKVNWTNDNIRRIIAAQVKQYSAKSADERRLLAIRENDYAKRLDELRTWAQMVVDRLAYQSARVEFIARAYLALQQSKRQYNGNRLS
jgi:hypothetical protein